MRGLLRGDKGVSIMIGYVLLVVIAVGLATLVFTYLKIYVPTNQPSCPDNVALSIEELSCQNGAVIIKMMNRGLFSLDGAYIRIGEAGREYKTLLNADNVRFFDYFDEKGLPPGEIWPKNNAPMTYAYSETGPRVVEVEPALFVDDEWVLCNKAIIKQEIECLGSVLSVQIIEPSRDYDVLENVPLDFNIYNGQAPYTCWYNLTDGPGVNVDCDDPADLGLLNEDNYNLVVHVRDSLNDEATSSKRFAVTSTGGEFILNSPNLNIYEYRNGILNPSLNRIPLDYDFNGLANSCRVELYDPLQALRSTVTSCVGDNLPMFPALFIIDDSVGDYTLRFIDAGNNQQVYSKAFGVLVDPEITIEWEIINPNDCTFNLNYEMLQRKYSILYCGVIHQYESNGPGTFDISPCETRTGTINFRNLANGRHQFTGYVEDSASPRRRVETQPLVVQVSGDPALCNQQSGGNFYVT